MKAEYPSVDCVVYSVKKAQEQQKKGMAGTPRNRLAVRRPLWVAALVIMVCLSILGAYIYPPTLLKVKVCPAFCSGGNLGLPLAPPSPPPPPRIFSEQEKAARVVATNILRMHSNSTVMPKIAFMFLTPGPLPFESLWEEFFRVRLCFSSLFLLPLMLSFTFAVLWCTKQ